MEELNFKDSEGHTVGIEVEMQLVDKDNFSLTATSTEIINALRGLEGSVKHELMMSNLEINTKICSNIKEAEDDLHKKFDIVLTEAKRHNTLLSCAGTHPFSLWKDQVITNNERYQGLLESLKIVARQFNIFGFHVHIGISCAEKCIYIMNKMLYYLPHLVALSSNSPFWEGEDTGFRSYRTKVFDTLPTAGLPFYFTDWADYKQLLKNYLATGTIKTIRDLWWDIRPHIDFGTLEIRVCDTPSTITEVLAIASLIQALVKKLGDEYDNGCLFKRLHPAIIRENKWRACRYGLDGEFITMAGDSTIDIRKAISELVASLEDEAKALGSIEYFSSIDNILDHGEGAARQLEEWRKQGELKRVVQYTVDKLQHDIYKTSE